MGAVLKGAPMAFIGLLVVGLGGGFAGGCLFMAQEVANKQSLIELKDGQIDDYRKSIEERLKNVEQVLSKQQLSALEGEALTVLQKHYSQHNIYDALPQHLPNKKVSYSGPQDGIVRLK